MLLGAANVKDGCSCVDIGVMPNATLPGTNRFGVLGFNLGFRLNPANPGGEENDIFDCCC